MADFKIVSDELRGGGTSGRGQIGPATQALLDGKTILMPEGYKAGRHVTTLKSRGFRLRQHKRPEGMVLWAEKIVEPADG